MTLKITAAAATTAVTSLITSPAFAQDAPTPEPACEGTLTLRYNAEDIGPDVLPMEEIQAQAKCGLLSARIGFDDDGDGFAIQSLDLETAYVSAQFNNTKIDVGQFGEIHVFALRSADFGPNLRGNATAFGSRVDGDSVGARVTQSNISLPGGWTSAFSTTVFTEASPGEGGDFARGSGTGVSGRSRLTAVNQVGPTKLTGVIGGGVNQTLGGQETFAELSLHTNTRLSDEWRLRLDGNYLHFGDDPVGTANPSRDVGIFYTSAVYTPEALSGRFSLAPNFTYVADSAFDDTKALELSSRYALFKRGPVALNTTARVGRSWMGDQTNFDWGIGAVLTLQLK